MIESYFDSMPGLLAKLQGGNAYDVIFPTAEFVEKLIQTEQVLRIPLEKLKNFENIYAYFDDPWYDPGSQHSVPYSLYLTGIGYRADLLDNMTGSWEDLANPEAAGRIYVLDDYQEGIGAANLRNGYDLNTVERVGARRVARLARRPEAAACADSRSTRSRTCPAATPGSSTSGTATS